MFNLAIKNVMNIKIKYNLKTEVYPIKKGGCSKFIKCELCIGKGELSIAHSDRKINCPDCCSRGGHNKWTPDKWELEYKSISKVGQINVEISKERKITYMIEATGIGSGTVWYQNDLFLSVEDAKKEIDKRNKKLKL